MLSERPVKLFNVISQGVDLPRKIASQGVDLAIQLQIKTINLGVEAGIVLAVEQYAHQDYDRWDPNRQSCLHGVASRLRRLYA